jgi:lipopolysaccharide export system protein LptA
MFAHLKKLGKAGIAAFVLALALFFPASSRAGEAAKKVDLSREPVHIEADRMESDQKTESVLFVGNVEAHQADLAIKADRMTVFYQRAAADNPAANKAEEATRAIDRLSASGNIEIVKLQWTATGDQLEYISRERKIILTGNTKVWQDNNLVTGDRIVLFLDEGKSVVERKSSGEGERVKAFFYPDSKIEKKP